MKIPFDFSRAKYETYCRCISKIQVGDALELRPWPLLGTMRAEVLAIKSDCIMEYPNIIPFFRHNFYIPAILLKQKSILDANFHFMNWDDLYCTAPSKLRDLLESNRSNSLLKFFQFHSMQIITISKENKL